jgi:pimeloyl-ACP methyl ester carboxylesterase
MLKRWTGPLVLSMLVTVVACSGDDGGNGAQATDPTSPPTTESAGEPEGVDALPPLPDDVALPIVFVHGFAGSAQQFESQAMRFVANGYSPERIVAYDHDGAGVDIGGYVDGLDEVVDQTLADTGAEQVYLVGHSRGTFVSSNYLRTPARAAKVAKYVALDGAPCVDVVPCLAPTQQSNPGQSHVEVATSPESFEAQYEFLIGEAPEVVDIVPQREPVVLSGRAVNFPANTGRDGAALDVWEVDPATGARVEDEPLASFTLGADGDFGPVEVTSGAHYEYVLSAPGSDVQHHLYLQPYVRSSHLVRLLSSEPDGTTRTNTNVGDGHSAIIAIRMREWYAEDDGDLPGDQADVLELSAAGTEPVNVLSDFVGNEAIGLHLHDDAATPGETTLTALPYFSTQPFQSGVDVFLPASESADETITVTNIPRGDTERPQTINVPNWPSSGHSVSVIFTDFPVE